MPPDSEGQESHRQEREQLHLTMAELAQDLEYLEPATPEATVCQTSAPPPSPPPLHLNPAAAAAAPPAAAARANQDEDDDVMPPLDRGGDWSESAQGEGTDADDVKTPSSWHSSTSRVRLIGDLATSATRKMGWSGTCT